MKKILQVSSVLAIATIVKMFSGVIKAKFLAWYLGPAGVGIVSQALMYSMFTIQLCSLNMAMGVTKYISEDLSSGNRDKASLTINTARTFQLAASLLFIITVLPFSKELTKFVFSDGKYWVYFVGITLAIPAAIFVVGMADPVFYGFRKISEYTRLTVWYTVASLVILLVAAYLLKVEGVLIQIIITSVLGFVIARYFLRSKIGLVPRVNWAVLKDNESRAVSKRLFEYGLISFIPGNVSMFVLIYLRSIFMREYGVDANGYYQVAYAISAYYLPFVTNGLWGHFYPEMCSLTNADGINRELNQFVRFAVLASTAIAAVCVIFRKYIILTLFSGEFMKAYDLLAIQAIGDIFFILFCMFSTALMARRQFKAVIWISTIGYNGLLMLVYLIASRSDSIGFRSLNTSIAVTNFILVMVYMVHARYDTGFIITRANRARIVKSAASLAVICLIPDAGIATVVLKIAFAAAWIALTISRDEMARFIEEASGYFKKRLTA